jgi:hypothetical protein
VADHPDGTANHFGKWRVTLTEPRTAQAAL